MLFGALFGGIVYSVIIKVELMCSPAPMPTYMGWTPPRWEVTRGGTTHYWKGSGAEWLRAGHCRQVDLALSSGSTTSWIYDLDKLFIFTESHLLYLEDGDSCVHLLDCFEN